jgi:carbamoyl-phosphate synthase large subunit
MDKQDLLDYIKIGTDDRIYAMAELLRQNTNVDEIADATMIDRFFIRKLRKIIAEEAEIREHPGDLRYLAAAKQASEEPYQMRHLQRSL